MAESANGSVWYILGKVTLTCTEKEPTTGMEKNFLTNFLLNYFIFAAEKNRNWYPVPSSAEVLNEFKSLIITTKQQWNNYPY